MIGRSGLLASILVIGVVAGGVALVSPSVDPGMGVVDDGGVDDDGGVETHDGGARSGENDSVSQSAETPVTFRFDVDRIEECGRTCRDVTATLTNDGNETTRDVVVETNIYTDGDLIWEGEVTVGTLDSGANYTTTQRVELGYTDALKVERNDGWVTIETVVRYDGGTEVYTDERQVA